MPCHALLRFHWSFWQALGACRAQSCAEDHRIIRDFNRKSRFLNAKFCGKKVSLSSEQAAHLVHRASNDRRCHPCAFVREYMIAIVLIFKISDAKSREFRSQNYAISAPKVRARRKNCSQTQSKGIRCRGMHSCAFIEVFASAGRVSRGKTAPKIIESFTISTENHGF